RGALICEQRLTRATEPLREAIACLSAKRQLAEPRSRTPKRLRSLRSLLRYGLGDDRLGVVRVRILLAALGERGAGRAAAKEAREDAARGAASTLLLHQLGVGFGLRG